MDEEIFFAIKSKIQDEHSPVTYSWLQEKFQISPKETQSFLEKYVTDHQDIIVTYLNIKDNNNMNHTVSMSNNPSENSIIISLKPDTTKETVIRDFICVSIGDHQNDHAITCTEAQLVQRSVDTTQTANETISCTTIKNEPIKLADKQSPFLKKPIISNGQIDKNTKREATEKINSNSFFSSNKPEKTNSNSFFSSNKPEKTNSNSFFSTNKPEKTNSNSFFSSNNSVALSKQPVIEESKETDIGRVVTCVDAEEMDVSDSDSSERKKAKEPKVPMGKRNRNSNNKDSTATVLKKSPPPIKIDKKQPSQSNLFDDLPNSDENDSVSSLKKRRRCVIESDDDESDFILANDSFEQREPPSATKKQVKRAKTMTTVPETAAVKKEKAVAPAHDRQGSTRSRTAMKKVGKSFKDEEGFLVFQKVSVPVPVTDGSDAPIRDVQESLSLAGTVNGGSDSAVPCPAPSVGDTKPSVSKATKKKQPSLAKSGKQTNLLSFFQKNN